MTQKDLACVIGCEPSYISHIERISRGISIKHLFQIADAMQTTPANLVTEKSNDLAQCLEILQKLDGAALAQAKELLYNLEKHLP